MLFVAADHLNSMEFHGIEALDMIRLNLQTGEKAVEVSAFFPAFSYLQKALEYLEFLERPWELHYDLTSRLYISAADVALCLGHVEKGMALCDGFVSHSRSLEGKLAVQLSLARALARIEKQTEGMSVNINALRSINEFPRKFYLIHLLRDFRMVKQYFKSHSDHDILLLNPVADKVKEAAMEHLSDLRHRAYSCSVLTICILALLRCIKLGLQHGICAATADAIAAYGQVLIAFFGDQGEGQRMARLAKNMLLKIYDWDRVKAKNQECNILCNTAAFMYVQNYHCRCK